MLDFCSLLLKHTLLPLSFCYLLYLEHSSSVFAQKDKDTTGQSGKEMHFNCSPSQETGEGEGVR